MIMLSILIKAEPSKQTRHRAPACYAEVWTEAEGVGQFVLAPHHHSGGTGGSYFRRA